MKIQMPAELYPVYRCVLTLLVMAVSALSATVSADTVIDVQSMGQATQVLTDGRRARMDLPGEDSYMLVDYRSQGVLMVVPDKKQIIDMGVGAAGSATTVPAPRVELRPRGTGPQIAGYETFQYSLIAQGQNCGVVYGSQEAMHAHEMSNLFAAVKTMVDSQRNALGSFAAFMNVCTLATMDFAAHADTIGVPMRMIDASGKSVSEIRKINTDAEIPAALFDVPRGYQVVTMSGSLTQARENISSALREYVPQPGNRNRQRMQPYPY
jgi:hypothetical protein